MTRTVTCYDVDGNAYSVSPDKLRWRPSAYAIVMKDGQLLTAKHFGRNNLPGGGIELGETPEEAVVRETKEETGIDVANPQFLAVAPQFFAWNNGDGTAQYYQTLLLYYLCDFVGGEFSMEGFDSDEKVYAEMPEWYPLVSLDELKYTGTHDWRPVVKKVVAEHENTRH
jgi:8-oxo-dGTP diphosphatase